MSLASGAAAWYVSSTTEALARAQFLANAEEVRRQIERVVHAHIDVVRAATALIATNPEMSATEFHTFVDGLRLSDHYPGIRAIGFAERVRGDDRRAFVRAMELDTGRPFHLNPPGRRPEYYATVLIEPRNSENQAVIGFDLSTHATLHSAMERAHSRGQATVSAVLDLSPLGGGRGEVFAVVVPVYHTTPVQRVGDRDRAVKGYVFSVLSVNSLLQHVNVVAVPVALEVYDSAVASSATLVHASSSDVGMRYRSADLMHLGGRDWLIVVSGGTAAAGSAPVVRDTLLAGLGLAIVLFVILRAQHRGWATAARQEGELRGLALRDALTTLPNRALLAEHLTTAMALARRHGTHAAVLFLDLDDFKRVNDSFGHAVGDQLLQSIANRLLTRVRSSDTVSRYGGDEFVLLLTEIDQPEELEARIQSILSGMAAPHQVADHEIQTTVSVGVSIYPDDAQHGDALIQAADAALYQAKARGRNRYCFFERSMNPTIDVGQDHVARPSA